MENKFTKGLFLGGLLTAAAVVAFGMSKHGRECTKKIKEDLKPMAMNLKEKLEKLRDVAKEDFDELVAIIVEDYAKKKEIGNDSKMKIINALRSKWHEIKEEYAAKE
jgi:gas vesicle protein